MHQAWHHEEVVPTTHKSDKVSNPMVAHDVQGSTRKQIVSCGVCVELQSET